MKKRMKIVVGIELIVITLIFVYVLVNSPTAIGPPSGFVVRDMNFSFDFKNAEVIILATNPNFENPIILRETKEIELPPGTYYWKVKSWMRESEIKNFTILSHVALKLNEENDGYILSNIGNVDLNITETQKN
jgi:hypothetical protein